MTVCGPVRVVGVLGMPPTCITVGNRVMASWQRYGYILGNATVIGFEREDNGWIKVVVEEDRASVLNEDGGRIARWDWDRTNLCDGHWDGETQEESVGRWLRSLAIQHA